MFFVKRYTSLSMVKEITSELNRFISSIKEIMNPCISLISHPTEHQGIDSASLGAEIVQAQQLIGKTGLTHVGKECFCIRTGDDRIDRLSKTSDNVGLKT